MAYTINYSLGLIQDFIFSIVFSSPVPQKIFPSITFPKKVRDIHKRLQKELYNMNDAFPLLVNEDIRLCYMTNIVDNLYSGSRRVKVESIDEMIDLLFGVSPDELCARFIFCFDKNKMDYPAYLPLAQDTVEGAKYINSMQISDASKKVLLSALIDKEGYKRMALEVAEKAKEVTLSLHQTYDAYIKSSFKQFEDEQRIRLYLEKARFLDKDENMIVAPELIHPSHIKFCIVGDERLYYLGFEFYQYLSEYENHIINITLDDMGKLFSDKTRCDAVRILRNKEACLMDLSRELDVPNNTLYYHMQMLYDAGVVLGRNEGRRFYYRLNKRYFDAVKKLGEEFMEEQ